MNLLLELIQDYRVLDNKPDEQSQSEMPPDDLPLDDQDQNAGEEGDQLDQLAGDALEDETGDPDKQGLIRTVKDAHLVYKRKQEDGTFVELWIYNAENMRHEQTIRQAILSGTDIPVDGSMSEDGQTYSIWSSGNAEMLQVTGLPS